ncbi:nuclease S1, partial [Lecanoromycetidae sp. Uapishka_2]
MHCYITLALFALAVAPAAHAWGVVGHATIATIAENYLTTAGKAYVTTKLGKGVTMASVASWADSYRETTAGKFSAPYHFIDAEDDPPTSCSVDLTRDCGAGGCVVAAIANYTQRVQDSSLSTENIKEAMEFLIHFLGDVTQPLHDEAELLGGNEIPVTWAGTATNLHACWDTQMVEKAAGGSNSTATLTSFAGELITRIDNGTYESEKASWVSCTDIDTASDCALEWAQDANALNCAYVLKANETNQELDGAYYTGAQPYLELQIAKGGYRLGTYINNLAAAA